MIEATGLSKRYGRTVAVDNLSFSVQSGRVTGFLGPNGAGKSTTMRMILGLDAPTAGGVRIDGKRYRELHHPLRTVGALLDGGPVAARACRSDPITLPAGQQELLISPGAAFVVDGVQLAGPLADQLRTAATTPAKLGASSLPSATCYVVISNSHASSVYGSAILISRAGRSMPVEGPEGGSIARNNSFLASRLKSSICSSSSFGVQPPRFAPTER